MKWFAIIFLFITTCGLENINDQKVVGNLYMDMEKIFLRVYDIHAHFYMNDRLALV